ncbi:MAG: hypothetical protein VYE22_00090 [Myxococcota bacterium]|nr:hypothetical protein [Myxococcota bacterium]
MAKKQLNPENERTTSLDLALLVAMPGVIVVLGVVIWYLAELTTAAMQAG